MSEDQVQAAIKSALAPFIKVITGVVATLIVALVSISLISYQKSTANEIKINNNKEDIMENRASINTIYQFVVNNKRPAERGGIKK